MTKQDELISFIKERGGVIRTNKVTEAGFRRDLLGQLVKEGALIRKTRGVYAIPDMRVNPYFILQQRCPAGILSHLSALYLHNLLDQPPDIPEITVPQGYGTAFLLSEFPDIRFHYVNQEHLPLGCTEMITPCGQNVVVYDRERCICDIIKVHRSKRRQIDSHTFSHALLRYFQGDLKDIPKLVRYASILGVEHEIQLYSEVLDEI